MHQIQDSRRVTFLLIVTGLLWTLAGFAAGDSGPEIRVFAGMCDASAVETLSEDRFVVANDEDNELRVYSWNQPGWPVRTLDLSRFWPAEGSGREMDLEGVARLDRHLFWISSHGRNAEGRAAPRRHALVRIPVEWVDGNVPASSPPGRYTDLLAALYRDPRYGRLRLDQAAARAPKAQGGLNIEALARSAEGGLLIGFRSPLFEGRALIVPLLNPHAVLDGAEPPRFGDPIFLSLGGLGLRGALEWEGGYLLVAGPTDGGGRSRLFAWSGRAGEAPRELNSEVFKGFNPEGLAFWSAAASRRLLVVSDDGTRRLQGQDCKDLPRPQRQFRAMTLQIPGP
ncbi:MAG: DUF3616 domain-containing protein [Limisphaera sp.]|nr:DUF3616 domain-containing protein [Limisphaera sp.]